MAKQISIFVLSLNNAATREIRIYQHWHNETKTEIRRWAGQCIVKSLNNIATDACESQHLSLTITVKLK